MAYLITIVVFDVRYLVSESQKKIITALHWKQYSKILESPKYVAVCGDIISEKAYTRIAGVQDRQTPFAY